MKIPNSISKYKNELNKFELDTIIITAIPLEKNEESKITDSKFSGNPYLPININYPTDINGNPLILLAQINIAEIPKLDFYPERGIFQLFIGDYWTDIKDYKFFYHKEIMESHQDFSHITKDCLFQFPLKYEYKLTFDKKKDYGGIGDFRSTFRFSETDRTKYLEIWNEQQLKEVEDFFSGYKHKIGGYAHFKHGDIRIYNENDLNDILLLQIVSDDNIDIGTKGVLNIFINKDDLIQCNFDKVYYHWDYE